MHQNSPSDFGKDHKRDWPSENDTWVKKGEIMYLDTNELAENVKTFGRNADNRSIGSFLDVERCSHGFQTIEPRDSS